jgi:hypothetical protein
VLKEAGLTFYGWYGIIKGKRGFMSLDKVFWRVFMVKKQLIRGGIALLVVLFALGIAGCGDSDSSESKSSNTQLISISIGGGSAGTFSNAMAKDSWNAITEFVTAKLAGSQSENAMITLTRGSLFKGTVEIARVAQGGTTADFAPYVAGTTTLTLAHGDQIFIKMIAEDGTTMYYGAKVEIGTDAGVKSITFDNQEVNEYGTPAATFASITAGGNILLTAPQPSNGLNVAVTTNDPGATVIFGKSTTAEADWTGTARAIQFADGEFLGVKVTSANSSVTQYYSIKVELMPTMGIIFGTPTLGEGDYIDPLWDTAEEVPISKINRAESSAEFQADPSTSGLAKLLWDADGLWLMVEVTGPVSTNTATDYSYQGSSVELFINEGYPTVTSGLFTTIGGQYRLTAEGLRSGEPDPAVAAFNALGKFKAFKRENVSGEGGYTVMFQAPWRFTGTYPLKENEDKDISLEIQINCAALDGVGRIGVLKWYQTVENTYQHAEYLAPAKLLKSNNPLPAQKPSITTQPANQRVPLNATLDAFTVAAVTGDGGNLSYQWFSNTSNSATGGTAISGATGTSYTPTVSTSAAGEFFFYVVVTNTKGTSTNPITSSVARVLVYDPATVLGDIEMVKAGHPNWDAGANALVIDNGASFGGNNSFATITEVDIPAGTDLSTYVRLVYDMDTYENGVIVPVPESQWSNNISYTIFDSAGQVEQQYNGPNPPGYSWPLAAAVRAGDYSGGGKVRVTAGNKTNAVDKVVIRSIKFLVGE